MLEYDRIIVSEGVNNKTSDSHESTVCCYWYFFKINFTYQLLVCRDCQKCISLDNVATATVGKK